MIGSILAYCTLLRPTHLLERSEESFSNLPLAINWRMSSLGGLESIRDYSQGDSEWVETIERGRTIKKRRASVPASTLPPLTLFPPNPIEPTLPGLDLPFPYVLPSSGMNHPPFAIPTDPALFRLSTGPAKPQFDATSFAPLPDFPSTLNPLESFPHPSTIPAQSTLESLAALCGNLYENGSQPSPIKATFPDQEHASSSPQMTNKVPMKNASRSKSRQRKNQVSKNSSNDPVRPVPIAVPPREALRRHHCVHIGCNKSCKFRQIFSLDFFIEALLTFLSSFQSFVLQLS